MSTVVIHSTREIRRGIPSVHCAIQDDQKCHIVGLNLMKELINHYAKHALRVTEEEMDQLIRDVNHPDNIRCCSVRANALDKDTEREILDMLIEGTLHYDALSLGALEMFEALEVLLQKMKEHLPVGKSPLFTCLLERVEKKQFPLPLFCFACCKPAIACEVGGTRIFCDAQCQSDFSCMSGKKEEDHLFHVEVGDSMIGKSVFIKELPDVDIIYTGQKDTRCPSYKNSNIRCVWEGMLEIKLLVNNQDITLNDHDKRKGVTHYARGYVLQGIRWYLDEGITFFTFSIVKNRK